MSELDEVRECDPCCASVIVTDVGHTADYGLIDDDRRDVTSERRCHSLMAVGEGVECECVDGGCVDRAGGRSIAVGRDRDEQESYLGLLAGVRDAFEDVNRGRVGERVRELFREDEPEGASRSARERSCGRVGPGVAGLVRGAEDAGLAARRRADRDD